MVDYPLYLKFKVTNDTNKTSKILYLKAPRLEVITLYDENLTILSTNGYYYNDKTLYPYFKINIKPNETKIYYMRVTTIFSGLNFSLELEDEKKFFKEDFYLKTIFIFFIGILAALMIYALLTSIYLKNLSYGFYALYLFIFILKSFWYLGLIRFYLPIEYAKISTRYSSMEISFLIITWSFFAINFLKIQKYPKIYNIFKIFMFLAFFEGLIFSIIIYHNMDFSIITGTLFILFNIWAGLYIYKNNKTREARFFLIGYMVASFGYFMVILNVLGYLSVTKDYPYILICAITIEAFILLFALLEQHKTFQSQIVQIGEINHRVKNNLSLVKALVNKYHTKPQKLNHIINSIAEAHSQLYYENNSMVINLKQYLTKLLEHLYSSAPNKWIIQKDIIDEKIDIKRATNLGIIINEIITNSFKYVNQQENILKISLDVKNDYFVLDIEDNGDGFNPTKKVSGGLNYINGLVKNMLKGEIILDSINKTKYTIRWKR